MLTSNDHLFVMAIIRFKRDESNHHVGLKIANLVVLKKTSLRH